MQNDVIVYRIEDLENKGPYCRSNALCSHQDEKKHPSPQCDSLLVSDFNSRFDSGKDKPDFFVPEYYRFGFISIEQLRAWVYDDSWLIDLHKNRYALSVYEVERNSVAIGHTQVMFDKEKAKLLRAWKITDVFILS